MTFPDLPDHIQWRIHLTSPPEKVFETLASAPGRKTFWAAEAFEHEGIIHFKFSNGMTLASKVLERQPPNLFAVEYFEGSRVEFQLVEDGVGGTDLTLTDTRRESPDPLVRLDSSFAGSQGGR
jgi:uncharacterized protein YndB with AHSA1/START domain